jgi:uncharacterized protein YjbJ (UPF0337 family)
MARERKNVNKDKPINKDQMKGKVQDITGRVQRQAGEWTGDEQMQGEGAARQIKGKTQNVLGKVKEAGREVSEDIRDLGRDREHEEMEREQPPRRKRA